MLKGHVDYEGLRLECGLNDYEGFKDLTRIETILNENNILMGGYRRFPCKPKITFDKHLNVYILDLGI